MNSQVSLSIGLLIIKPFVRWNIVKQAFDGSNDIHPTLVSLDKHKIGYCVALFEKNTQIVVVVELARDVRGEEGGPESGRVFLSALEKCSK